MPKLRAFGDNIRAFFASRRPHAAVAQAARRTCVESLESRTLLSSTWYVAVNGSDSNQHAGFFVSARFSKGPITRRGVTRLMSAGERIVRQ